MEICNFPQGALTGINLVGYDASLHGVTVSGDLIAGLFSSLPYIVTGKQIGRAHV